MYMCYEAIQFTGHSKLYYGYTPLVLTLRKQNDQSLQ